MSHGVWWIWLWWWVRVFAGGERLDFHIVFLSDWLEGIGDFALYNV